MADMITILNTIRANASADYQARVPVATRDNITEIGSSVQGYQPTENEFLNTLVNKIAMQIVHNKTFRNPLAVLKKGTVPLGRNIEEIYTNPATGMQYDPNGATLLNVANPDTKTIYHAMNRQGKYKVTISKAQLMGAFRSYGELEKLLNTIVSTLYSGDNLDEFLLMKELFASGITGGKIKQTTIANVTDEATAKAFIKGVKTIGEAMKFPSSSFNSYADVNKDVEGITPAITWTPLDNQVLIIRSDISVNVDVELLAKAFNVSYAEMKQRTLTVDGFGSAESCGAVLCDEAMVQVHDNLTQMENFHNGEGLYDSWIWHHWQTYSLSLFANAMAFMIE